MNTKEFLELVSIKEEQVSPINGKSYFVYLSKFDKSYLTIEGQEESILYLVKNKITEQLQSRIAGSGNTTCVGYSPTEEKWFGWSHRAIFGFGIGSKCKKGHCHYTPSSREDFMEFCIRFWEGGYHLNTRGEFTDKGVDIYWIYGNNVPNEDLRGTVGSSTCYFPEKWGKGEWEAKTMEDAKQMAVDFAKGVS